MGRGGRCEENDFPDFQVSQALCPKIPAGLILR